MLLVSTFKSTAQNVNPVFFQTWHLDYISGSDLDIPYNVALMTPAITPKMTVLEDLTYTGEGSCNTFEGVFSLQVIDNSYVEFFSPEFSSTQNVCFNQDHDYFELVMFDFLQNGGWFEITAVEEGYHLIMSTPIFGYALFRNYALSNDEFEMNQLRIYPNPASNQVFIKPFEIEIAKIEIFNSLGQNVKIITDNFETISISELLPGIHFLKIFSKNGSVTKKIMKQ